MKHVLPSGEEFYTPNHTFVESSCGVCQGDLEIQSINLSDQIKETIWRCPACPEVAVIASRDLEELRSQQGRRDYYDYGQGWHDAINALEKIAVARKTRKKGKL